MNKAVVIESEAKLQVFANAFVEHLPEKLIVYLEGDLGAGKTTFVRALLRELGYQGKVKSPTFTLVEPYLVNDKQVYHFDLYRLNSPEELEYIGIRDFADQNALIFVEWPEKGRAHLPPADLRCKISVEKNESRLMLFDARTPGAEMLLTQLESSEGWCL